MNPSITKDTAPDSFKTFTNITFQCLRETENERPNIHFVVEELEKSLLFQENYEWESKLPKAYKKIIKKAKSQAVYSNIKELYYILYSGILLNNGHWFSLSEQGENCEMVPATSLSCQRRIALRQSRFPKVGKMLELSNLNLRVKIKTKFLSPGITYATYLVFKFCFGKNFTCGPIYVELKYRHGRGRQTNPSTSYFAEWGNNGWMKINLGHITVHKAKAKFNVLLMKMSRYYCGNGAIYIEGIEFLPIENGGLEVSNSSDDKAISRVYIDLQQQLPTDYQGIIERSQKQVVNASNREFYDLLSRGILIDDGKKFFFLSKLEGKKCHMLSAREVLHDSSNNKRFNWSCVPEYSNDTIVNNLSCRFKECVELLSYHEIRLKCCIELKMLSRDTVYSCYLVYNISEKCRGLHSPVKAKNLLPTKKNTKPKTKASTNVYLRSPSLVNALKSIKRPVTRKDGWMEVKVWEFNPELERNRNHHPLNMKLICLEGNMSGLILYGLEFRPK